MENSLKNRLQYALNINGKKAVDLSKDLNIPKSAISQYLSGVSQNMPSDRLCAIAQYLDVSEAWLAGYSVPMDNCEDDYLRGLKLLKKENLYKYICVKLSSCSDEELKRVADYIDGIKVY